MGHSYVFISFDTHKVKSIFVINDDGSGTQSMLALNPITEGLNGNMFNRVSLEYVDQQEDTPKHLF